MFEVEVNKDNGLQSDREFLLPFSNKGSNTRHFIWEVKIPVYNVLLRI
jgi:hypothetical protein